MPKQLRYAHYCSVSSSSRKNKAVNETCESLKNEPDLKDSRFVLDDDDDEVQEIKSRQSILTRSSFTDKEFSLINSRNGWLHCTIIHEAQVILKMIDPLIEGFQRPTLGPRNNFDIVGGEFIQLLQTGGNHWVCVSSIGCTR